MTREEKIDRMLESIESWDEESLFMHTHDCLKGKFIMMSDALIDAEYGNWFDGKPEEGTKND